MLEGLIGLSDKQMDTVVRMAAPLDPRGRALFLVDMARAQRGRAINDATIAAACVEARQRGERT